MKYIITTVLTLFSFILFGQNRAINNMVSNSFAELNGSISEYEFINSDILNKTFRYRVYLPPNFELNKKTPVVYVNDGKIYFKHLKTPQVVDSLIINKIIKPVAIVFLEPKDGNDNWKNIRDELFFCNDLFVDFYIKEFIPSVEDKHGLKSYRKERSLLGVSFGGLATAYLAHKAPKMFRNIAMQSPAFWPCQNIYRLYAQSPKKNFKIYLSYGTNGDTMEQDLPMIEVLEYKDYDLKVRRVENGKHELGVWEKQIDEIFIYFFKK